MPEWYNLTLIQKALVLCLPIIFVIGYIKSAGGSSTGGTPTKSKKGVSSDGTSVNSNNTDNTTSK